jgi:restriction endonuclease
MTVKWLKAISIKQLRGFMGWEGVRHLLQRISWIWRVTKPCGKSFPPGQRGQDPPITKTHLQWRKGDIAIGKAGVEATERGGAATVALDEGDIELPDLLTDLQDRTQLTRRSIQRILSVSGRLDDFKRDPQQFIELAAEAINRCKRLAVVYGIKYQRLGDEHFYAQELFEQEDPRKLFGEIK